MKLIKTVRGMAPFEVEIPDKSAAKIVAMFPGTYHFPKEENRPVQEIPPESSPEGEETVNESTYKFTRESLEALSDEQLRVLYKEVTDKKAHPSTLRENLINKLLGMNS